MAEFWSLTPRETHAALRAAAWQMEQRQRQDAWLAWHIVALSRRRRLPRLSQMMTQPEARALEGEELELRREERDEMLARVDIEKLNEAMRQRQTSSVKRQKGGDGT